MFQGRPTYHQFYGLMLNSERARYRKTHIYVEALKAASMKVRSMGYYRAISDSEAEANMLMALDQAEASHASRQ